MIPGRTMLNNVLYLLFGINGPIYLNDHWTGLASNIGAYIWKTMPFWTIILLAGRMAVPQELYEAAAVDGANGLRRFAHVTLPLMANLYIVCTLLDTVFTLGDFNSTYFVSGGGPAMSTEVLATLGIRYAFTTALPRLGVATVMTALPLLIPLVFLLMRKLRMNEVQL
jgi:multiple sugar transport system permease protein